MTEDKELLQLKKEVLELELKLTGSKLPKKRSWKKEFSQALLDLCIKLLRRNTLIVPIFLLFSIMLKAYIDDPQFDMKRLVEAGEVLESISLALLMLFGVFLGANQAQRYISNKYGVDRQKNYRPQDTYGSKNYYSDYSNGKNPMQLPNERFIP